MDLKHALGENVALPYAMSSAQHNQQPCPGCQKIGGERLAITGKGRLAAGAWHHECVYEQLKPWIEGEQAQPGGFNPHGALVNVENLLARQRSLKNTL